MTKDLLVAFFAVLLSADITPTQGAIDCPAGMPAGTTCIGGRDANGAFYQLARPADWNHRLVVFAHGGPTLLPITQGAQGLPGYATQSTVPLLQLGYGIASSSYRDPYWNAPEHAQDLANAKEIFVNRFGAPNVTVIYGGSYGTTVALTAARRYPAAWDGVVLEDGNPTQPFPEFYRMIDFRVVYQYFCHNLPRSSETPYPLWQGLGQEFPVDYRSAASVNDAVAFVRQRGAECTGDDLPASRRTPAQARALRNILAVTHVAEGEIPARMVNSTLNLQTFSRFQVGGNAFTNAHAIYSGSDDDRALNRDVARYEAAAAAYAAARALFPDGHVTIPVISTQPVYDDHVTPEDQWVLAHVFGQAGNLDRLVQFFTDGTGHIAPKSSAQRPRNSTATLVTMFNWIASGKRPTGNDLLANCNALTPANSLDVCGLLPHYQPPSPWSIIPPGGRIVSIDINGR